MKNVYRKLRVSPLKKKNVFLRDTRRRAVHAVKGFWQKYVQRKSGESLKDKANKRQKNIDKKKKDDEDHEKKRKADKERNLNVYRFTIGIPKEKEKLNNTKRRINTRLEELRVEEANLRDYVQKKQADLKNAKREMFKKRRDEEEYDDDEEYDEEEY